MPDFLQALQNGTTSLWLFIPTAILLGALHGLEPGHSKTMMAAFIVAIRGTVWQAVLLGLSAAISHSLIIWLLAALALHFGNQWNAETTEPYFQLGSAAIIVGLAVWMFWRTRRDVKAAAAHSHDHDHRHSHDDTKIFDTGHGVVNLTVFETGVPPVFRLAFSKDGKAFVPKPSFVTIETVRPDGARQTFAFVKKDEFLESTSEIPEPHEFDLTLTLAHGDHSQTYPAQFREDAHHHHHGDLPAGAEFQDAHEAAHALDIQKRLCESRSHHRTDRSFRPDRGTLAVPGGFHRAARLYAGEAVYPRLRARGRVQLWAGDHDGHGRRCRRVEHAPRAEKMERLWRPDAPRAVFFQRALDRARMLYGLARVAGTFSRALKLRRHAAALIPGAPRAACAAPFRWIPTRRSDHDPGWPRWKLPPPFPQSAPARKALRQWMCRFSRHATPAPCGLAA